MKKIYQLNVPLHWSRLGLIHIRPLHTQHQELNFTNKALSSSIPPPITSHRRDRHSTTTKQHSLQNSATIAVDPTPSHWSPSPNSAAKKMDSKLLRQSRQRNSGIEFEENKAAKDEQNAGPKKAVDISKILQLVGFEAQLVFVCEWERDGERK